MGNWEWEVGKKRGKAKRERGKVGRWEGGKVRKSKDFGKEESKSVAGCDLEA